MKNLTLTALLCLISIGAAYAQTANQGFGTPTNATSQTDKNFDTDEEISWTEVWYGINGATAIEKGNKMYKRDTKPVNFGAAFSRRTENRTVYTLGLSYVTKGCKYTFEGETDTWSPTYLQGYFDIGYAMFARKNFVPYVGVTLGALLAKDGGEDLKSSELGYEVGFKVYINKVFISAGLENGITEIAKEDSKAKFSSVYLRAGYRF